MVSGEKVSMETYYDEDVRKVVDMLVKLTELVLADHRLYPHAYSRREQCGELMELLEIYIAEYKELTDG